LEQTVCGMILTEERRSTRSAMLCNTDWPGIEAGPKPLVTGTNRLISRIISIGYYESEAGSRILI